jgi:Mg2+ and Co2+ transporter CorA
MYPTTKILEMIFVFAGLMTALGCFTGIVITALKRRSQALPSREVEMRLGDIVDRLSRIENSFESTAIEVERISEAQRYTAKVRAARSVAPAPMVDRQRGSTTPH